MWTKASLCELVKEKLRDYRFFVVSNREPYIHTFSGKQITVNVPASGLTIALDPVMQACGGTWVAHGSGDADRDVVDQSKKWCASFSIPLFSEEGLAVQRRGGWLLLRFCQ